MTKSEAFAEFRAQVLPSIVARYERDGVPDKPARREAWNNHVDSLIREGVLPERAEHWTHPRGLETCKALPSREYTDGMRIAESFR